MKKAGCLAAIHATRFLRFFQGPTVSQIRNDPQTTLQIEKKPHQQRRLFLLAASAIPDPTHVSQQRVHSISF